MFSPSQHHHRSELISEMVKMNKQKPVYKRRVTLLVVALNIKAASRAGGRCKGDGPSATRQELLRAGDTEDHTPQAPQCPLFIGVSATE